MNNSSVAKIGLVAFLIFAHQGVAAGDRTIDGGPGSDTLTISYGSISSLDDFTIDRSGDYTSFTDGDGNEILFKNIETIVIGGISYVGVYDGIATTGSATLNTSGNYYDPTSWTPGGTLTQLNFGNNIISSAYYDDVNEIAYMYPYGDGQGSHLSVRALNQLGYDNSSALSIFGTAYNDLIAGQEGSNSAALTINSYAGLDVIDISNHTGADTVDAGAGNDIVHVNSSYASDISIDGGAGTDWLIILSGSSSVSYTINSSSTSNFENVRSGYGDDTITGDDNANRLVGWGGADTLSGGAGDDELYGYVDQNPQGVTDGIDSLYGGAGDDSLYGGAGDDLLDGGTGRDILSGEGASGSYDNGGANGADTFVIRAGDGGATLELADVITDFEDGTDQIGLDGISFNDLTIEQGTGSYSSHVVVKKTDSGEFLTIIQNHTVNNITYLDMVSTSTSAQTLTGSSDGDVILGGSGNDTITSGSGDDIIIGYSGNDSITINGVGDKTIDGGPGSDTLTISYGSISSLDDFTIDRSGDYTSFTDGDGNEILFKNIETIVIGGISYVGVYDGIATTGSATLNTSGNYYDPTSWTPGGTLTQLNFGNNIISSAYYDDVNEIAYMYPYGDGQGSHLSVRALNQLGYDNSSALSIFGTAYNDLIAGQEGSNSAALTINSYAGLDVIDISNHTGADTVDAGAGNDIVHVNSSYASDISIDGGAGTDWLIILSGSSSVSYTINSSSTSNFENVRSGYGDDTITGDDNANRLVGWGGADTLSGGAGDDELYGYVDQNPQGVTDGIDSLYGGAGDDSLYGGAGDDLLDGGTGRDILSGEGASGSYDNGGANGADTFVIRAGDGGATLELADVITDFEDGTDQIGLDGISFNDLTIEQGTGSYSSHVVVKKTDSGEFLTIIQNHTVNNITYLDMVSTSTSAQTLTGSSDGDVILGGSGNDTITSGSGDDIIIGYSGNDSITINGVGDKTIDGGPGSDTLTISYGSISSLDDFTIDRSGDYTSFTDGDGNEILFKNIETIVIGGISYVGVYDGIATTGSATLNTSGNYYDPTSWTPGGTLTQLNFGNNIISSAYYDDVNEIAYMYPYGDGQGSHLSVRALNQLGYDNSSALSIFGTAYNDLIAGQEGSNSAALTINSYAGLDVIDISNHTGADTVDAGAGNDIVHVNSSYASDISIDGGAGTDWLIILSGSSSVSYTINSSSTSNFENVRSGYGDDTITGDDNANRLVGWGGADTLSGGAGDDELYGYVDQNPQGVTDGIDSLYGGAGDDSLYGGAGDDLLDGGTGRDILSGEGASGSYDNGGANGADTFVIRAGDGGATLELADVITDFEDGDDIIGMSGLNYSDLTIEQGTGSYSSHVVVKKISSGEFLTIIQNISLSSVDDNDFSAI